jgi:hypothetical protein
VRATVEEHFLDSLADGRKRGILEAVGQPGSDFVQIHVGHARQHSCLVHQGLALKTSFPEPACAAIFFVGLSSDVLIQSRHEKADAAEAPSPLGHELVSFFLGPILNILRCGRTQKPSAPNHLLIAPQCHHLDQSLKH